MIQRDPRRTIGQILYFVLISLMLGITAPKTVRAVEATLPESDKFQSYIALVAVDGGLLVWLFLFKHNADSFWRRGVALAMTVVCLLATIGLAIMDSFLQASAKGLTAADKADLTSLSVWLVVAAIGLNIIAGVAWEVNPHEWISAGAPGAPDATQNLEVFKITSKNETSLPQTQKQNRIVQAERVEHLDAATTQALEQARVVEPVKARRLPPKTKK